MTGKTIICGPFNSDGLAFFELRERYWRHQCAVYGCGHGVAAHRKGKCSRCRCEGFVPVSSGQKQFAGGNR